MCLIVIVLIRNGEPSRAKSHFKALKRGNKAEKACECKLFCASTCPNRQNNVECATKCKNFECGNRGLQNLAHVSNLEIVNTIPDLKFGARASRDLVK